MVFLLKMGIWEAEEHARELSLTDVICQILHGIRSHNRGILILQITKSESSKYKARIFLAEILNTKVDILGNLHTDF